MAGARGPTGPQGQARTSPAGGKAGAVTRSAPSKPASTASKGSSSVSRISGGTAGSNQSKFAGPSGSSRSPVSSKPSVRAPAASAAAAKSSASKTGLRGPLGPQGQPRSPIGRNPPTGRRGPLGAKGEPKLVSVSGEVGAGKKYGPMPRGGVVDLRRMQGPPNYSIRDYIDQYRDKVAQAQQRYKQEAISGMAGDVAKTGAQYGPLRAQYEREINDAFGRTARNYALQNVNQDRSLDIRGDTAAFRRDVSSSLPAARLPSRTGNVSSGPSNRFLGNEAFGRRMQADRVKARTDVRPSGPRTRGEEGPMFKHGGLVKKKKK